MYKRRIDGETLCDDRRGSIGSVTTLALGSEVGNSRCNLSTLVEDHYNPTLRLLQIPRSSSGALGFHLTRSKWDPYPWVSGVDVNTPAKYNGLKVGECVLEVNGEDVLGLRISDIARLVKGIEIVSLLLWTAGCDTNCNPQSLCCGPMPLNLERLSACMQTILTIIECPVCKNTIAPPVLQCQNGHILCVKCRILSTSCPVCRQFFCPGRSLIAEQIYNSIVDTFNLRSQDKLREKLFGVKYKRTSRDEQLREVREQRHQYNSANNLKLPYEVNKSGAQRRPSLPGNKFLAKLLGKAQSMQNLSTSASFRPLVLSSMQLAIPPTETPMSTKSTTTTNQLNGIAPKEHEGDDNGEGSNLSISDGFDEHAHPGNPLTLGYSLRPATISKQFSLSAHDLSKKDNDGLVAIERCPSMNRLQYFRSKRNSLQTHDQTAFLLEAPPPSPETDVDRKTKTTVPSARACASLTTSIECVSSAVRREDEMHLKAIVQGAMVRVPSIPVPTIRISSCVQEQNDGAFYLCPVGCGNQYSGSTLQQHVKADHEAAILCYGGSSAEFSLPLRAPLDEASVLLMCDGKDFWIKLRTHGDGRSFTASALLQGPEDESSDFMMETRLRNRLNAGQDEDDDIDNSNGTGNSTGTSTKNENENENKNCSDNNVVVNKQHSYDGIILERELITRSIVPSMMATTWADSYQPTITTSTTNGDGDKEDHITGMLYSRESIRMAFGEAIDYRNLLLKIIIKRRVQEKTTLGKN